jgi:ABC-type Zn uptake system ZnuABC Zn-binding protein ZnuA
MLVGIGLQGWASENPLRVVATLPDYAAIAKEIGGER